MAKKITYLGSFYSNPSKSTLIHHIFFAKDLVEGEQQLDDSEFIEFKFYDLDDVLKKIKTRIDQLKKVAG